MNATTSVIHFVLYITPFTGSPERKNSDLGILPLLTVNHRKTLFGNLIWAIDILNPTWKIRSPASRCRSVSPSIMATMSRYAGFFFSPAPSAALNGWLPAAYTRPLLHYDVHFVPHRMNGPSSQLKMRNYEATLVSVFNFFSTLQSRNTGAPVFLQKGENVVNVGSAISGRH